MAQINSVVDKKLAEAWAVAFERTEESADTVARGQFLGFNVCVKIPEVFAAAVDTVKAGGSVFAAIVFPAAWPATIPFVVWESYCAARSVFSALIERMEPLEYVTVAILATHEGGVDEDVLADEVEKFVKEPNTRKFSWHLGMTEERIDDAGGDIHEGWISHVVRELDRKGFVEIEDGKLFPKPKNMEWKIGF
ncbi:hypothetical protein QWJ07_08355 [Frankia sp. RB7]|nr:hypothetical protein [Frankia sp. RB7]